MALIDFLQWGRRVSGRPLACSDYGCPLGGPATAATVSRLPRLTTAACFVFVALATACTAGPEAAVQAAADALEDGNRLKFERHVDMDRLAGDPVWADQLLTRVETEGPGTRLLRIDRVEVEGNLADVETWLSHTSFGRDSVPVRLRLERAADDWRIVGIPNRDTIAQAVREAQVRSAAGAFVLVDTLQVEREGCEVVVSDAGLVLRTDRSGGLYALHESSCEAGPQIGTSFGGWDVDAAKAWDRARPQDAPMDRAQGLRPDGGMFNLRDALAYPDTIEVRWFVWGMPRTLRFARAEALPFDTASAPRGWVRVEPAVADVRPRQIADGAGRRALSGQSIRVPGLFVSALLGRRIFWVEMTEGRRPEPLLVRLADDVETRPEQWGAYRVSGVLTKVTEEMVERWAANGEFHGEGEIIQATFADYVLEATTLER